MGNVDFGYAFTAMDKGLTKSNNSENPGSGRRTVVDFGEGRSTNWWHERVAKPTLRRSDYGAYNHKAGIPQVGLNPHDKTPLNQTRVAPGGGACRHA